MIRIATRLMLLVCLALTALFIISCAGPGYYYQAAKGQLELIRASEPVSDVLIDPDTNPNVVARLKAARQMLHFAENELDLPADDSYSTYAETGRRAVVWNVVAAPEFSLEAQKWCFPVAGCVPYRGYFNEAKARQFAQRLRSKGLDVLVQAVSAYSTLGWFKDPLLDTMLRGSDDRLATTLFHELAHRRVYLKGDTTFSESYASFVGIAGTRVWLSQPGNEELLADWQTRRAALARFRQLQAQTRRQLIQLYESTLPDETMSVEKQAIFDWMEQQYRNIVELEWQGQDWFGTWISNNRNNAALALFGNYQLGVCAFESLLRQADGNFSRFHELASRQAELEDQARLDWLHTPCPADPNGIASDPNV